MLPVYGLKITPDLRCCYQIVSRTFTLIVTARQKYQKIRSAAQKEFGSSGTTNSTSSPANSKSGAATTTSSKLGSKIAASKRKAAVQSDREEEEDFESTASKKVKSIKEDPEPFNEDDYIF